MIELNSKIIEKLLKDSLKLIENSESISFKNLEEVTEKIPILKCGIVYFIFSNNELKYIGKSKGKLFRSRVKSHFFGIGKGTSSKHSFLNEERKTKNLTLKYIKTKPESLRNLLEEILIEEMKNENRWNYK